jgi:hypothetical protein
MDALRALTAGEVLGHPDQVPWQRDSPGSEPAGQARQQTGRAAAARTAALPGHLIGKSWQQAGRQGTQRVHNILYRADCTIATTACSATTAPARSSCRAT